MRKYPSNIASRRELLAAGLRYGTLGVLVAAGGSAFIKRRRLLREGKCINDGVCRDCKVFEDCGRPEALSAKEAIMSTGNGGQ
ncbi:MAG: hypothetical protein ACYS76_10010 [Planctomycetota bacterium]|jgi:hypothetical protein